MIDKGQSSVEDTVLDGISLPEVAESVGLRYVRDHTRGYTRRRRGRGMTYLDAKGQTVRDPRLLKRFASLAIPPAWTNVWIATSPYAHIQATGRDAKGRKQYIYHPRWNEIRNESKFNHLIDFSQALPAIRSQVEHDLGRRGLPKEKVVAVIIRLLEMTNIRIGHSEYARANQTYGLTTLLTDHLVISGSRLSFQFRGKSGKEWDINIRDRRLASLVQRIQELPGQYLFQYIGEDGKHISIHSDDVNQYIREISGQDISAKDFRTWAGTMMAAELLYDAGPSTSQKEAHKKVVQVVKEVAKALGNTTTVCRQYYIHPAVVDAYNSGRLFEVMGPALAVDNGSGENGSGLTKVERAVLTLLQPPDEPEVAPPEGESRA